MLSGACHGARGVPANPKPVFTEIAWRDGQSLPEGGPVINTFNLSSADVMRG